VPSSSVHAVQDEYLGINILFRLHDPEDERTMILHNTGKNLPVSTTYFPWDMNVQQYHSENLKTSKYNHIGIQFFLDISHHWAISSWHYEKCCDVILEGWNVQEENLHAIFFFFFSKLILAEIKLRIHVSTHQVHLSNYLPQWINVLHKNTPLQWEESVVIFTFRNMNTQHPLF
jgi:hypothetical protein